MSPIRRISSCSPGSTPYRVSVAEPLSGMVRNTMDSRLDTLKQSLQSAVDRMSTEQLSWHLPGKWCAAEVLEHLYLTYAGTNKGFEKVITSGKLLATRAS